MTSSNATKLTQLRKRSEFVAMRSGEKIHTSNFLLQVRARCDEANAVENMRVGYTVTKKTGNAVMRNRIKRRLREVARRSLLTDGKSGHDYVLIGKSTALNARFVTLREDMGRALKKIHRNRQTNSEINPDRQDIKNGQ